MSRAIEMYSRSVTPTPGHDDQEEAKQDKNVEENYPLTNISEDGPSVKYFNYHSSNLLPAKSLAQEMLDVESESDIYNESSKLLDNIEN